MKKQLILRSLLGAPIGLAVTTVITIIISLCTGHGEYYPAPHELIDLFGSPMKAVLLQTVCALIYGAIWGGASVIWRMEEWSLLKQTLIHLAIILPTSLAISLLLYWMPRHIYGALSFCAMFIGIYVVIWFSMYMSIRNKIKKLNAGIGQIENCKTDIKKPESDE
ncbi:MAG: DUF3021 domain-containing protein [Clostridia bacterium]|nr:DUF3021 domain-containing protein [Clostridia bacterium]